MPRKPNAFMFAPIDTLRRIGIAEISSLAKAGE